MAAIKRILFPTDFSPAAEKAFLIADPLAKKYDAELHVLHAIQWHGARWLSRAEYALPEADQIRIIERMRRDAEEEMSTKFPPKDYHVHIIESAEHSASESIVDYARSNKIDLIVMGARGEGKFLRKLLGGTVEHVIEMSDSPILVTRGDVESTQALPKKLLAAVDFTDHTEKLLRHAAFLARELNAELDVIHVIPPSFLGTLYIGLDGSPVSLDEIRKVNQTRLEEYVEKVVPSDVFTNVYVAEGDPSFEIAEFAKRQGTDLLVVATHAYTGVKRLLLGSVARRAIQQSPCSVFVVKSHGRSLVTSDQIAELNDDLDVAVV